MASITKRTGKNGTSYLAQIRMKGHKPASATFKRKKDAEEWVKVTQADIIRGRYFRHSKAFNHTMGELFDKYEAWPKFKEKRDNYSQTRQLEYWRNRIGDKLIGDVDSALIDDIRDELSADTEDKPRAPATVNRYLALLSHVYTYGVKVRKWAEENPCKNVMRLEEPPARVRYLSDDERTALLTACKEIDPTLHLITVFALSTGARMGEIQNLRWPNVDLKAGQATLVKTKNKDTRTVPLTGHLLDLLKAYKKKQVANLHSDLVFPSPLDATKTWNFRTVWDKAIKQAEIKDFHFHDTRHCFASYCLASQATLPELMHLMGHKSPAMVAKYAHMVKNHASSIVERMNAKMFGS